MLLLPVLALSACSDESADPVAAGPTRPTRATRAVAPTSPPCCASPIPATTGWSPTPRREGSFDEPLAEAGATIEWVPAAGSFTANFDLLKSGTINTHQAAVSPILGALSNGLDFQIFAISEPSDAGGDGIVATAESGITTVEDLEGKRVAVNGKGHGEWILLKALTEAGVDVDSVERVPIQPPDAAAAFASGEIDAWATFGAFYTTALAQGGVEVLPTTELEENDDVGVVGAAPDLLESNPEAFAAFVEVLADLADQAAETPEEFVNVFTDSGPEAYEGEVYDAAVEDAAKEAVFRIPTDEDVERVERVLQLFVENGVVESRLRRRGRRLRRLRLTSPTHPPSPREVPPMSPTQIPVVDEPLVSSLGRADVVGDPNPSGSPPSTTVDPGGATGTPGVGGEPPSGLRRPEYLGQRSRPRTVSVVVRASVPVALLAIWWIGSGQGWIPDHILSSPEAVWDAFRELWRSGDLTTYVAASFRRAAIGLAFGIVVGLALGVAAGLSVLGEELVDPTMQMIRAVPFLALVPLFLAWFGIDETFKVVLIASSAAVPMYTYTYLGVRNVDRKVVEAARGFGLRGWRLVRWVILPSALPNVMMALRICLVLSMTALISAESIGTEEGIGYLVLLARQYARSDYTVLCVVLYAGLGIVFDLLIRLAERYGMPWHRYTAVR